MTGLAVSDTPMDVQDLFARFTLDTAGSFLFGTQDFNTLSLPLPQPSRARLGPKGTAPEGDYGSFVVAFEDGQGSVVRRASSSNIVWTVSEFFGDKLAPVRKGLDDYLMPLARKAVDSRKERVRGGLKLEEDASFLDHLAASTDGQS